MEYSPFPPPEYITAYMSITQREPTHYTNSDTVPSLQAVLCHIDDMEILKGVRRIRIYNLSHRMDEKEYPRVNFVHLQPVKDILDGSHGLITGDYGSPSCD